MSGVPTKNEKLFILNHISLAVEVGMHIKYFYILRCPIKISLLCVFCVHYLYRLLRMVFLGVCKEIW